MPVARLIDAAQRAFWQPLAGALAGVRRVHLITGPGHHGLPLECGAAPELPVHRYFGLPAYLGVRDRPLPLPRPDQAEIVIDAAWQQTPIPFVETEAALVRTLLRPAGQAGRVRRVRGQQLLQGRTRSRRLLLCLHGGSAGQPGREHGYLVLDAAARPPLILDPPGVSGVSPFIAEVYASACLGAMVGSADSGSAIGVCSEWQLRGVSAVIACLAPVEDHYMPLLAALYWHGRLQRQSPWQALADAKTALTSGDWPAPLIEPLERAYRSTMRKVLRRAIHRTGDGEEDARRAGQTTVGWLLPPYIRSTCFEDRGFDAAAHREFSARCCATAAARERLIGRCLDALIGQRGWPEDLGVRPYARAAIANICAVTHCFGHGGALQNEARLS
jgi:hypothetical protein